MRHFPACGGNRKGSAYTLVNVTQALYDEATQRGWIVISMKNDWKRVFTFDENG